MNSGEGYNTRGDDEGGLILPPIQGRTAKAKWDDGGEEGGMPAPAVARPGVKLHIDLNMENVVERDAYEQRQ